MSNVNPYLPPEAELDPVLDTENHELATLSQRFWAAMIDGIIGFVTAGPIMYFLGLYGYARRGLNAPMLLTLGAACVGFMIFLAVHGYFLKRDGQTLGKKFIGTRIVDLQDKVPEFWRIVFLRYLPMSGFGLLPGVGHLLSLVNIAFVFRSDRRCVHDLIAGTRVIKVKKS